jgi:hypothetical protein
MSPESTPARPVIFYDISHPVQALMLHPVIRELERKGFAPRVFGRDKDVCLDLLRGFGLEATTLATRRWGRLGAALELVTRELRMLRLARAERPVAIIGTSVHAARVGKLCRAASIVINDDDAAAVPFFAHLAYPLADVIVTPDCLAHENHPRQVTYRGNQQLFYLHPARFHARPFGIRDGTRCGSGPSLRRGSPVGPRRAPRPGRARPESRAHLNGDRAPAPGGTWRCLVSAENPSESLPPKAGAGSSFPPSRMHHVMAAADPSSSGTVRAWPSEAAVLGTPAFRMNDFVGENLVPQGPRGVGAWPSASVPDEAGGAHRPTGRGAERPDPRGAISGRPGVVCCLIWLIRSRGSRTSSRVASALMPEVLLVVGTRPEAIKLLPVYRALRARGADVAVVTTGQHTGMVGPLMEALDIPVTRSLTLEDSPSLSALSAALLTALDGCSQISDRDASSSRGTRPRSPWARSPRITRT